MASDNANTGHADCKVDDHANNLGCNGIDAGVGDIVGPMLKSSIQVLSPLSRRPPTEIQMLSGDSTKNFHFLTLTVRKDENGYGMKVSGDNPVFVESVKPGGAAQIAGLIAGDMILRVNGTEVRSEKHPTVVSLIKASTVVELAVKRSQKYIRPTSVGIVPLTPVLSGRDRTSITAPQPVDSIKRREMETYKIQTLQKMLEQEKLNLERLKSDKNNPSYKLSEANMHKLREQLRQIGAEDTSKSLTNNKSAKQNKSHPQNALFDSTPTSSSPSPHIASNIISPRIPAALGDTHMQQMPQKNNQNNGSNIPVTPPQQTTQSSPAFLSLLPRSLSSLSLGGRKNKIDRELITSPFTNTTNFLHITSTSGKMVTVSTLPVSNEIMLQSLHATPTPSHGHRYSSHRLNHSRQQEKDQLRNDGNIQSTGKIKNKLLNDEKKLLQEDIPPPLPQRNSHRHNSHTDIMSYSSNSNTTCNDNNVALALRNISPISDLDHTNAVSPTVFIRKSEDASSYLPQVSLPNGNAKRSKAKMKALSDPKISTTTSGDHKKIQQFGVVGNGCNPPPLPPRQQNMMEESHKISCSNSIDTLMQYPLIATCTPVHRDNLSAAFPLSHRPNIVQQLQQYQYQQYMQNANGAQGSHNGALGSSSYNLSHQKHRRIVSAPDSIHGVQNEHQIKTNSGSWELLEKDDEITPPGTPPPPYRHDNAANILGNEDAFQENTSEVFHTNNHWNVPSSMSAATHSSNIQMAQISITQKEIISMEDEDTSDQEGPFIDENGPFNSLQRLLESENIAFLAVFLNYVLSNSEPSPLLFYLITGLYKDGTAKDMRKWVYEIHSTFLVPRAPLVWYRQDESLAREVDAVLQNEFDKVEILRKIFWKSRKKARDIICEQLREFQNKRTAGLGTIYGPTDAQLLEAKGDKQREQNIFEETLMKKLQILIEEYEKDSPLEDAKKLALCSALSTVIHRIFIPRSHPNSLLDRVHHFVSREKSFKSRIMGKKSKIVVRGHSLVLRQYYEVTHCNHCQTIIWGVSPQGLHCTDCKLNIHRPCSKVLEESCLGPLPPSKRKDATQNDNKITKLMGKIRPRSSNDGSIDKRIRQESEDLEVVDSQNERIQCGMSMQRPLSDRKSDDITPLFRSNGNTPMNLNSSDIQNSLFGETSIAGLNSSTGATVPHNMVQEIVNNGASLHNKQHTGGGGTGHCTELNSAIGTGNPTSVTGVGNDVISPDVSDLNNVPHQRLNSQHLKSGSTLVNRSESYKERLSHKRSRTQRKTSDPSLISQSNDEQTYAGASISNLIASSNSSLSSSIGSESYSNSMEQMGGSSVATTASTTNNYSNHQQLHPSPYQDLFQGTGSGGNTSGNNVSICSGINGAANLQGKPCNIESDDEDDFNEVDWSSNVPADILLTLSDSEKKRQEIINEIYQTERSHVRTLKLLDRLFFNPLQESCLLTQDYLLLLFPPSLSSLCDLHGTFEQKLKTRRIDDSYIVSSVGDLLIGMFDGVCGDELREYAALFCARQKIALEMLKEKRRKDEQLQKLLSKAESHKACRRLQLKDLLPTVLQRLTKYPLLFENLYKISIRVMPENETEADAIQRAWELSKNILVDVNQAVKTAEDTHKLQTIQRKLDKSTFDKEEFRNLDLTQYRLIHDGGLTMKKNPSIQLYGLLFESMIVLLTKQDDKYSLKYLHAARNTEVNNKPVNPIMSIDSETLVRQEAADKNSFFLIKTKTSQMLELRAPSSTECKTWFKCISNATEQYKLRSKNSIHDSTEDNTISTLSHSNYRESLDLSVERDHVPASNLAIPLVPLAPVVPTTLSISVNGTDKNIDSSDKYHQSLRNMNYDITGSHSVTKNGAISTIDTHSEAPYYYNSKQASNAKERTQPSASVNRTMSTRSCCDTPTNGVNEFAHSNVVTLRHTKSARQANESTSANREPMYSTGSTNSNARDDSIVYCNNSNNTRTLMQSSAHLIKPSAIKMEINASYSAMTALTTGEKLKRLDASIRDSLREKQKIICDMFSLPLEHFHEIVDIAAMPEAPKDSVDIALAAFAQVQQLIQIINHYMQATSVEEVFSSTTSSSVLCDKCTQGNTHSNLFTNRSAFTNEKHDIITIVEPPPPLPPPKKHRSNMQTQQVSTCTVMKKQVPASMETHTIHENDDGYCEIDELRLPAVPHLSKMLSSCENETNIRSANNTLSPTLQFLAAKDNLKSNSNEINSISVNMGKIKEQTIICVDSIPEESAEEVSKALQSEHQLQEHTNKKQNINPIITTPNNSSFNTGNLRKDTNKQSGLAKLSCVDGSNIGDIFTHSIIEENIRENDNKETIEILSATKEAEAKCLESNIDKLDNGKEIITQYLTTPGDKEQQKFEIVGGRQIHNQNNSFNEDQPNSMNIKEEYSEGSNACKIMCINNKPKAGILMVDSSSQTLQNLPSDLKTNDNGSCTKTTYTASNSSMAINNHKSANVANCGVNRSEFKSRLEPSVPCYFLSSIITTLNAQITLLLPKINERDLERDRLRHENQHLRELLNAMHERRRVEEELKTPKDEHINKNVKENNEEFISKCECRKHENLPEEETTDSIVDVNANIAIDAPQTLESLEMPLNIANNNESNEYMSSSVVK